MEPSSRPDGWRLPELRAGNRRVRRARRLRRHEVRAARGAQAGVGPGERLPRQPQPRSQVTPGRHLRSARELGGSFPGRGTRRPRRRARPSSTEGSPSCSPRHGFLDMARGQRRAEAAAPRGLERRHVEDSAVSLVIERHRGGDVVSPNRATRTWNASGRRRSGTQVARRGCGGTPTSRPGGSAPPGRTSPARSMPIAQVVSLTR